MTKREATANTRQAAQLIFDVEKHLVVGEHPRIDGYRARIAINLFEDGI